MTEDTAMTPVWSALRVLFVTCGSVLAAEGFGSTGAYKWLMIAGGAVGVVGPAIWDVWVAIARVAAKRQDLAKAVQAGINLTLAGQAVTTDGSRILVTPQIMPVKPVTETSATEIIAEHAPASAPKA